MLAAVWYSIFSPITGLDGVTLIPRFHNETPLTRILDAFTADPVHSADKLAVLLHQYIQELADFLANKVPINPTALAIRNYIDMHLTESLSLDHLADTVSLSRSRLIHLFQEVYHVAPYQYYLSQKCKLAQSMLSRTTLSVSAISTQLGFLDPHHFSSFFKKQCGLSPLLTENSTQRLGIFPPKYYSF